MKLYIIREKDEIDVQLLPHKLMVCIHMLL